MPNSPHPDRVARTWRLPKALVAALDATAKRRGMTVIAVVVEALEDATSNYMPMKDQYRNTGRPRGMDDDRRRMDELEKIERPWTTEEAAEAAELRSKGASR